MMSSIDMASSSASGSSAQRSNSLNLNAPAHNNVRYASNLQRTGSPVPHPQYAGYTPPPTATPGGEAGRLNTEQLVLDFFFKVTEVVLHSRVHLPSEPSHTTQVNRRVRFNLDVEEVPHIRASMTAWREDVHLPLTIDVYYDSDSGQRVLLERWSVVYTYGLSAVTDPFDNATDFHGRRHSSTRIGGSAKSYATAGSSRDVLQILREVLKKFTIQLRALHCFMRLLPAHRFFRQSYPSTLSYEFSSCEESQLASGFEPGLATNQYSFPPINTPFGFVKVATVYRRDCSALERRRKKASKELIQENYIIQDYVPASPELAPAAPPSNRSAASPSSPLMIPPSSFAVRQVVDEDDDLDRRHRSSPDIGANESDLQEDEYTRAVLSPRRSKQQTSQPMAIPQQVKSPTVIMSLEDHLPDNEDTASGNVSKPVPIVQQHPHSYGDPSRIRTLGANPNVAAAPYGYRNVAIERGQTPPLPGPHLSTSGGYAGQSDIGSFHDHISSPHPLSTPPRHPHSILTPRTLSMRTSFVSSVTSSSAPGGRRSTNDYGYRASLENFSLDSSSPSSRHNVPASPAQSPLSPFHFDGKPSRGSFESQRSVTPELPEEVSSFRSTSSNRSNVSGTSPQLTPPFVAGASPAVSGEPPPSSTAALVLRRPSPDTSQLKPAFESSPPFQPNPSELLSTSPGYSHSKHYQALRRGSSGSLGGAAQTTTELALTRTGSFRTASGSGSIIAGFAITGSSPLGGGNRPLMMDSKSPAFSTDTAENGVGIWGISPDSGESFAMSIGASTRRRYLSSGQDPSQSGEQTAESHATTVQDSDNDLFMLPFAVGDDGEKLSTATTVTATSSIGDRAGSFSGEPVSAAWDTATVGSFLQQLKNAPRLHHQDTSTTSGPTALAGPPHPSASLFDDELESFRSLRNELSRVL